jgi:hypothetical protein
MYALGHEMGLIGEPLVPVPWLLGDFQPALVKHL